MVGFIIRVFFFKNRTNVCFSHWSGNLPSMIYLLKFCKIKLTKMSALSLIILKEISSGSVKFELAKLLISFGKEGMLLFIFSLRCYATFNFWKTQNLFESYWITPNSQLIQYQPKNENFAMEWCFLIWQGVFFFLQCYKLQYNSFEIVFDL